MSPSLPDTVTPERFQRAAPLLIQYLLETEDGFADGIDEIRFWKWDGASFTGQFVDRRPTGDRVFEFELTPQGGRLERSYRPVSGVDFAESESAESGTYPDQEALDAAINALDDVDFQEQITGVVQPILDLVQGASDYQEVQGRIAALYPELDSSALEEKLSKAIFVSEVWGRVNAADG